MYSQSVLYYDRRSVGQSVLVSSPHLGLMTRFLLLSDSWGFVDMGHPLWREDGPFDYNVQYTIHFTVSDLRLPQPGGPGPCIYIPQEQGGQVIPPGTGYPLIPCWTHRFFFRRMYIFLWKGQWKSWIRYSNMKRQSETKRTMPTTAYNS
jgi:hypothetical protein